MDASAASTQSYGARILEEWDENAILGVEQELAAGASLQDIGLSHPNFHAARVRHAKEALAHLCFGGGLKDYFSKKACAYLKLGIVSYEEVSVRPEDQYLLKQIVKLRMEDKVDQSDIQECLAETRKAQENA